MLPALGLGVFQTPMDETRDAVGSAHGVGYRHTHVTLERFGREIPEAGRPRVVRLPGHHI